MSGNIFPTVECNTAQLNKVRVAYQVLQLIYMYMYMYM